jgi:hypothetical protein
VRVVRLSVLLAVVTVALAVPIAVLAGGSGTRQAAPTFALGRTGGNIIPAKISIGGTGRVTITGPMKATLTQASLPLRNGLARLAVAEGFFSMPAFIQCPGTNPDFASRFVTISAGGKSHTVTSHGACRPAFEELYAVLSASVGAQ